MNRLPNNHFKKNKINFFLFIIIPLLFIIVCFHFLNILGPIILRHGDPDYIYLLSGACIGQLKLNVGHFDNPGTPLQIIVAIVTRIVHLFSGHDEYINDIIKRPDFYLKWVIITNIFLVALSLIFMAYKLNQFIDNVFSILMLQVIPLLCESVFYNFVTVIPEVLIVIPVTLLITQIVKQLFNNQGTLKQKDFISYILISALGLSIKLDYLPLFLLPVFMINTWRKRILYIILATLAFLIFAFPILFHPKIFIEWVKGLIMYSGKYGSGEKNIINLSEFINNFKLIYNFIYPIFILLAFLFVLTIFTKFKKHSNVNKSIHRLSIGLISISLFTIILVAKHFGLHYLMPLIYLTPFIIYIIVIQFSYNKYFVTIVSVVAITTILITFFKDYKILYKWQKTEKEAKLESVENIRTLTGESPFLIMDQHYEYYFPESALLFGWFFQGSHKQYLKEHLILHYENRYIFDGGLEKFFLWEDLYTIEEIIQKHESFFLFLNGKRGDSYNKFLERFEQEMDFEIVYHNSNTNDKLFSFTRNKP